MKTVILYAYPPEPDGLSLQGHLLYRGLKENGEDVVPCHYSSDFQKEWVYKYFKPDIAIGIGYWNNTPDLVHHTQKYGVTPIPWLVADGWVANYHKTLSDLPLVLATSEWVKETYKRDGVNTENFHTSHIGLDTDNFKPIIKNDPRVASIRKMLGIEDNEVMILTVGGDVTSKGAQEVLNALKLVDKKFKNWKYVCKVWGGESADDHYENEMKLIEELGDSRHKVVYLEGSLSQEFMPYLLNACDIYAAPSRLEGYGMIQVEAQACGKPVISINKMGPKETVLHNETGFLADVAETVKLVQEKAYDWMGFDDDHIVEFNKPKTFAYRANVNEISEYLLRLMENKELRLKMGHRAREYAVNNFEYHKIANQISNTIKRTLKLI
jgi:alpha-maltose-1-phosphate synthase